MHAHMVLNKRLTPCLHVQLTLNTSNPMDGEILYDEDIVCEHKHCAATQTLLSITSP